MNKFEKISKNEYSKLRGAFVKYEDLKLPTQATKFSAGFDFYATFNFELKPGEAIIVPTGIKCQLDNDKFLGIYPRSGLGFKNFVRLANTVGIVDSDYYNNEKNEGQIFIKIRNEDLKKKLEIKIGDAFAQGIIQQFFVTDDRIISDTVRAGGMGSTDNEN